VLIVAALDTRGAAVKAMCSDASDYIVKGNSFLGETDFREAKHQFEIANLKRRLEEHGWNVSQTAVEIGLQRQSLREKLRELGTQRPGK
jgi:DNA-binding NtrC family response regulator